LLKRPSISCKEMSIKFRFQIPSRTYTGPKLDNYRMYKEQLQSDFNSKCGYCDVSDKFSGSISAYHVDHFAPVSKFPHLREEYTNLVYSCPFCNLAKGSYWATDTEVNPLAGDEGLIDPCTPDYDTHLMRNDDGTIWYTTELGRFIYKRLKLFLRRKAIFWELDMLLHLSKQLESILSDFTQYTDSEELRHLLGDIDNRIIKLVKYISN